MSASTLIAPSGPALRFRGLLVRMAERGLALARRLAATAETDRAPTLACIRRISRALCMLELLRQVFAGTYRATPPPAPRAAHDSAPAGPDPTRRPRPGNRITTAMRRAFASRPIGKIVASICQDLDIAPGSDAWPTDLVALTQTPTEWVATPGSAPTAPPTAPPTPPIVLAKPPRAPSPRYADRDARKLRAAYLRRLGRPKTGHDPP